MLRITAGIWVQLNNNNNQTDYIYYLTWNISLHDSKGLIEILHDTNHAVLGLRNNLKVPQSLLGQLLCPTYMGRSGKEDGTQLTAYTQLRGDFKSGGFEWRPTTTFGQKSTTFCFCFQSMQEAFKPQYNFSICVLCHV